MTDCPNGEIRDLLPDLVNERLTTERRREVDAHVRGCADCQEEVALLRTMRTALRRAPTVDAGAIAASIPAYRAPVRHAWGGWRAAAAAIVVLVVGGTSVAVFQRERAVEPSVQSAPSVVAVREPVDVPPAAQPAAPEPAARELALGSASVSELDDSELSALLADLETLDVLPPADVENAAVVSAGVTTGTN